MKHTPLLLSLGEVNRKASNEHSVIITEVSTLEYLAVLQDLMSDNKDDVNPLAFHVCIAVPGTRNQYSGT